MNRSFTYRLRFIMVFHLIGLGLGSVDDISVKGLNIIRHCSKVYLECYTSLLSYGIDRTKLEEFYEKQLYEADRELVEQKIDQVLVEALSGEIALLVVGDPFGATTHADLVIRARNMGVTVNVVHNASILNAVGCCGLQLYNFGITVSIPMWIDGWEPDSFMEKIALNRRNRMHTLCLLDIKVKEQSVENLIKCKKVYEPPTFLTCSEAAKQLLLASERIQKAQNGSSKCDLVLEPDTQIVGLARVGWSDQKILFCTLAEMVNADMGPPLHCLIIPADELHPIERDMLKMFAAK